jgi:iron complex transport system ATP-binding protein
MFRQPLTSHQLTAGYGKPIVHNVDIRLEPGQLTILVGANGCGKSTLLKALARTLVPQQGQVLLYGRDIQHQPSKQVAQQLGLLPQSPIAPENLTVRELVALGRFPYQSFWSNQDQDKSKIAEAMVMANVMALSNVLVDQLSGGQRQRCWIAMALAQDTNVLLLDEPTTYLDLKVQVELMQLLQRLSRDKNCAMAIVMHELNLAAAFADKLVMMKEGRIIQQGQPQDIFTEENLAEVFQLDAQVIIDSHANKPFCIPRVGPKPSAIAMVGS